MLSLDQCRRKDPRLAHLTDEELLKIRDQLYAIGTITLSDFFSKLSGSTVSSVVIYPLHDE